MKSNNNAQTDLIDILNLSGDYIKRNEDNYIFSLLNFNTVSVDEVYKIIDPSNDQAFKILFNGDYTLNNINGLQRAKSLIQSLLYEINGDKIISKLEYLPNEIPEIPGCNGRKLRVLDCPFLCSLTDNTKCVIDLEIQNYYYDGLDLNALGYGTALRNFHQLPVIIIVLLLKNSNEDISFEIKPGKKSLNETEFKPIDDYVWVFCLDLYYILDCINNNSDPQLGRLKLSKEGKEWIKLLTIKEWMKKCSKGEISRYPVPKNLNNSKEIINAIKILSSKNNSDLIKKVLKEAENNIFVEDIKNEQIIETWAKAFLKRTILDESIIPFPKVFPEFLIRKSKNILKNKNDCSSFLKWLIENNIIESKIIYQILLDKIYK